MVEFTLILPVLFLLLLGIVDLGLAVWDYNTIAFLTRDAERHAEIVGYTDVVNYMTGATGRCATFGITCTATSSPPTNQAGVVVTSGSVTINYTFQPVSLMIFALLPGGTGTLNLQATSQINP
jgi:Flp pilus assembly protein TadG